MGITSIGSVRRSAGFRYSADISLYSAQTGTIRVALYEYHFCIPGTYMVCFALCALTANRASYVQNSNESGSVSRTWNLIPVRYGMR